MYIRAREHCALTKLAAIILNSRRLARRASHRGVASSRSVYVINEDTSTVLMMLSRTKEIFSEEFWSD